MVTGRVGGDDRDFVARLKEGEGGLEADYACSANGGVRTSIEEC